MTRNRQNVLPVTIQTLVINIKVIQPEDFSDYFNPKREGRSKSLYWNFQRVPIYPKDEPKYSYVPDDIPIKPITKFSVELAFPLAHIIDFGLMESIQIS